MHFIIARQKCKNARMSHSNLISSWPIKASKWLDYYQKNSLIITVLTKIFQCGGHNA